MLKYVFGLFKYAGVTFNFGGISHGKGQSLPTMGNVFFTCNSKSNRLPLVLFGIALETKKQNPHTLHSILLSSFLQHGSSHPSPMKRDFKKKRQKENLTPSFVS